MKKTYFIIFGVLLLTILFSCSTAEGTALVTGKERAAISPDKVVIYAEPPAKYEVIGIVTASSDSGWTEQEDLNYAIEELKKQAAKIGANGVLLENVRTAESGGVISYGVYVPISAKEVSGKAIYVYK